MRNTIIIAAALSFDIAAETITLAPAADTALFQNSPGNNLGRVNFMPVGLNDENTIGRGLLKFDLSAIPANAVVTSVSLRLAATRGRGSHTLDLHRIRVPWTEGLGAGSPAGGGSIGTVARSGEPTWNHRQHDTISWGAPGGAAGTDYESASSASITVNANTSWTLQSPGMVADLQAWLQNPGGNHGWLIKARDESSADGTAHRYSSREATSGSPALTIIYEVSAEPAAPTLENPSMVGPDFAFQFAAEASIPYRVEYSETLPPNEWLTLTNIPAAEPRPITITDPLTPSRRFYRVQATPIE